MRGPKGTHRLHGGPRSEVMVGDGQKSGTDARRTEARAVCTSGPDVTVASPVDGFIEHTRVPFDSSDAVFRWLEIEEIVHRLGVPECGQICHRGKGCKFAMGDEHSFC